MAIPDYIILDELKVNEDIYLISKGLEIKDNIFILKYYGSAFLYPEQHYFILLNDYFQMKKPDEIIVEKLIQLLCKICVDYKTHPCCVYEEGVTFDHINNFFFYPKQLIGELSCDWDKNAFGAISKYLHKSQNIENNQKVELQKLIEEILQPQSNQYQELALLYQVQSQDNSQVIGSQQKSENLDDKGDDIAPNNQNKDEELIFKIEDNDQVLDFVSKKREQFENKILIEPTNYQDEDLLKIFKFAYTYKKVGQHKAAKSLFNYYQELLKKIDQLQIELFDQETPEYEKVKIPVEQISEFLENLTIEQRVKDGLVYCQFEQLSEKWHKQRKMRITASQFGKVKTSIQQTRNRLVQDQIYPKFFGNAATRYGNETESEAREQYVKMKKDERYEVREFGLMVDEQYIWIAGSPDGIVYQDNQKIIFIFNFQRG